MLIKILYVVLVLCVGAVLGAVVAGYFRIRRHLNGKSQSQPAPPAEAPRVEQEIQH